jgi:hypothetical protein
MRNLLISGVAALTLGAAALTPASAQVYFGAEPGGAGVQVGPFGFGVGPRYDRWREPAWRYRDDGCRMVRERIETPSGRVIFRTHRECD